MATGVALRVLRRPVHTTPSPDRPQMGSGREPGSGTQASLHTHILINIHMCSTDAPETSPTVHGQRQQAATSARLSVGLAHCRMTDHSARQARTPGGRRGGSTH